MIRHRGLTLFELLLVLVLLTVLGALSLPVLEGAFSRSRLRHAGDQVRGAWMKARLASMQSGQTHAFRCRWGERYFIVQPYAAVAKGEEPEFKTPEEREKDPPGTPHVEELAEGVTFLHGQWLASDTPPGEMPEMAEPHRGEWSDPILFLPDGTTADASLALSNDSGHQVRATLRGLTGVSVIGEVGDVEDRP